MKKLLAIIAILIALFVMFWNKPASEKTREFHSTIMLLSFEHPEGYVIQEKDDTITIMLEENYQSVINGEREGGEGPPVITIRQIDNPNNPGPREWAEQYSPQSNYHLKTGEVSEIRVAGFPGISYEADGLYPNKNVIFGNDFRLYYLNGQYLDRDSVLYRDFDRIVDSVKLK